MLKSKDKNQSQRSNNSHSHSKPKKQLRETNSYQVQFKIRVKNKSKIDSKDKSKSKSKDKNSKNNKNINTQSTVSAKTYNLKPTSSLIKENINNNAVSYSNFAFSEMERSKKDDNNILCDSYKYNNEDLLQNNLTYSNNSNKLNINDLSNNSKNMKISSKQSNRNNINNDNNINKNKNRIILKNNFSKRAAYSQMNENQNIIGIESYNISKNNYKNKFDTSLKRIDEKLNNDLELNYNKMNLENIEHNLNNKKILEQYISSNSNNYLIENEENNMYNRGINNNIINNNNIYNSNEEINPNGQDINQNYINEINSNNSEDPNYMENEPNSELYNELEEKLQNLYLKIRANKEGTPIPQLSETSNDFQNQITYPNLKRYRQKSEPNLRIKQFDTELFNNFNNLNIINIDSNNLRGKNNENNILPPHLIVKYPSNLTNNKNLSKIKLLEENLKNENSTKRMINLLLSQQDNPELKNILSELQMTIKKLPRNEDSKENYSISTLPANYLFPFDMFNFEKIKNLKCNSKFNLKDNSGGLNNVRKIEKLKSKFNDFQEIINKKSKIKNSYNVEPKGKGFKNFDYYKSQKIYTNLCPVNFVENEIYSLDN